MAIEGSTAAVGASGADTLATEAGSVYVFDLGTQGANYCQANANSTGLPALLPACGSTSLASNDLTRTAQPVPDQFHLFFHSNAAQQVPFGDGFLCAASPITRLNPPMRATGHLAKRTLDFPSDGIQVADTFYFQCWYRDPTGGGAGFNLSNGLELTILP